MLVIVQKRTNWWDKLFTIKTWTFEVGTFFLQKRVKFLPILVARHRGGHVPQAEVMGVGLTSKEHTVIPSGYRLQSLNLTQEFSDGFPPSVFHQRKE
jgi:hypothetical protein